jgi:hypothetical protein
MARGLRRSSRVPAGPSADSSGRYLRSFLSLDGPAAGGARGPHDAHAGWGSCPGGRACLPSRRLLAETGYGRLRYPAPPEEAIEELRSRYLGPDHRAGQGIRNTSPSGEDDVFQAAGFRPADIVVVPDGREIDLSIDKIVAGRFSVSGTAPHLFADRIGQFESDLRALLADASPSGLFSVRLPDNILRIWRPA